jgi:hypothetical protein
MKGWRRVLVLAVALVLVGSMVNFWLRPQSYLRVSAVETTTSLGVYWDAGCSSAVESVSWGALVPGQTSRVAVYVRNEGARTLYLQGSAVNWQGDNASNCLMFGCESPMIRPDEAVRVTMSLLVFANASKTSFGFGINLVGFYVTVADFDELFGKNSDVRLIHASAAMTTDSAASAFVSTKLASFSEGVDTEASFVDQTSGRPMGASGSGVVSFGGPLMNPVVEYAESGSTAQVDRALVMFRDAGGVFLFQLATGSSIPGASLPVSAVNGGQDVFLVEVYMDGGGRYVMLCYGFGWKGTYAAGKYFDAVVYPNLSVHLENWIVVRWDDTNANGLVDGPYEGDAYTVIAQGS